MSRSLERNKPHSLLQQYKNVESTYIHKKQLCNNTQRPIQSSEIQIQAKIELDQIFKSHLQTIKEMRQSQDYSICGEKSQSKQYLRVEYQKSIFLIKKENLMKKQKQKLLRQILNQDSIVVKRLENIQIKKNKIITNQLSGLFPIEVLSQKQDKKNRFLFHKQQQNEQVEKTSNFNSYRNAINRSVCHRINRSTCVLKLKDSSQLSTSQNQEIRDQQNHTDRVRLQIRQIFNNKHTNSSDYTARILSRIQQTQQKQRASSTYITSI